MKCPNCRKDLQEDVAFCNWCGTKILRSYNNASINSNNTDIGVNQTTKDFRGCQMDTSTLYNYILEHEIFNDVLERWVEYFTDGEAYDWLLLHEGAYVRTPVYSDKVAIQLCINRSVQHEYNYYFAYHGYKRLPDSTWCQIFCKALQEEIDKRVLQDIPEVFFVKNLYVDDNFRPLKLKIEYRFTNMERIGTLDYINKKTEDIIRELQSCSDYEKARGIHDYLVLNMEYKDIDAPYSHEAAGALLYNISVCEGISKCRYSRGIRDG